MNIITKAIHLIIENTSDEIIKNVYLINPNNKNDKLKYYWRNTDFYKEDTYSMFLLLLSSFVGKSSKILVKCSKEQLGNKFSFIINDIFSIGYSEPIIKIPNDIGFEIDFKDSFVKINNKFNLLIDSVEPNSKIKFSIFISEHND